jgi:hypothetical protein
MGPRNAYKDMLDNVVSPIACVNMDHQNHLEQMANGAMFATNFFFQNFFISLWWYGHFFLKKIRMKNFIPI